MIGLNLCPFAKGIYETQLRFIVSDETEDNALLNDLEEALLHLHRSDPGTLASTLIIVPHMLIDFDVYNQFLNVCDERLESLGLVGDIQIASFHPRYRFAETTNDAAENYTNRSPFPLLHLLREADVTHAIASHPDTLTIPDRNMALMQEMGQQALQVQLDQYTISGEN